MNHRFKILNIQRFATVCACIGFSRRKGTISNNKKMDQATKEHRK